MQTFLDTETLTVLNHWELKITRAVTTKHMPTARSFPTLAWFCRRFTDKILRDIISGESYKMTDPETKRRVCRVFFLEF